VHFENTASEHAWYWMVQRILPGL